MASSRPLLRAPDGEEDGALLLRLLADRGPAGLTLANGAFALAIAGGTGSVLLVRDAIGERTLFHVATAASGSLRGAASRAGLVRAWISTPCAHSSRSRTCRARERCSRACASCVPARRSGSAAAEADP